MHLVCGGSRNSLLCGLVKSNEWHFFVVESTSSKQQPFRMSVTGYSTFNVNPPKPDDDDDDDDDDVEAALGDIVSHIIGYLQLRRL